MLRANFTRSRLVDVHVYSGAPSVTTNRYEKAGQSGRAIFGTCRKVSLPHCSQDGFRLHVSSRLRRGQIVEVILDEDPGNAVRCRVIWIGKQGSKQEGEVGLETV